jgi:hypothetical protein
MGMIMDPSSNSSTTRAVYKVYMQTNNYRQQRKRYNSAMALASVSTEIK